MDWFHGTTEEMARLCQQAGSFPAEYTSQKAVWGPGVYMSENAEEVSRWGKHRLQLDVSEVKLWDVSGESWGWGPITVADNLPDELRKRFREETRYESPRFRFGGEVYGEVLREMIEAMGYDGIIFSGDGDVRWAVCYKPELIKARSLERPSLDASLPTPAHAPNSQSRNR